MRNGKRKLAEARIDNHEYRSYANSMFHKFVKSTSVILMLAVTACSDSRQETVAAPYVTNAEYVLEQIETAGKSGVAFQVKPIRKTACKHMYIEIGQKDATGQWNRTNVQFPGKDNRNKFGQNDLKDQIHFAEIDGVGEFGVIALGCEPYNDRLRAIRGLLATFDVEPGKLNYIGEIALIPQGANGFFKTEVADKTDFALDQIRQQLPALELYFQSSPMEKYVVEISPERQAALDRLAEKAAAKRKDINKRVENSNRTIDARNQLSQKLTKAKEALAAWDRENGYPYDTQSVKQEADREALLRVAGPLSRKVRRYDTWITQNVEFSLTEKYMKLEAVADQARQAKNAKYPFESGKMISKERMNDPNYKKLSDAAWNADVALREFAERHNM